MLNAWALWQILRGPASPRAGALPRDVVWLRRLLYADVAGDMLLWELLDDVSGVAEYAASWAVWAATMVLLVRALAGVTARFRIIALELGLTGVLTAALRPFTEGPLLTASFLLGMATVGCEEMIIAGQGRDERFSAATAAIGWTALLVPQVYALLQAGRLTFDGLSLAVHALDGLIVVWAARTAHELAAPGPGVAATAAPVDLEGRELLAPVQDLGISIGVAEASRSPRSPCSSPRARLTTSTVPSSPPTAAGQRSKSPCTPARCSPCLPSAAACSASAGESPGRAGRHAVQLQMAIHVELEAPIWPTWTASPAHRRRSWSPWP
ncbi:hypothetical protein [Streptosporangium sandarakinum]|uniref:hypothetical protein n=1 Tax=Streptosporangium sandarakinum TaxID=1260955 RepID=UPI0034320DD8